MNALEADRLMSLIRDFVDASDDLRALAVCGSWARGNARPDSDLDLLILARNPTARRRARGWLRDLDFGAAGFRYQRHETATYGTVWSLHVALRPAAELELTVASEGWASVDPIDGGTRQVVDDGFRILVDKDDSLSRLQHTIGQQGRVHRIGRGEGDGGLRHRRCRAARPQNHGRTP